MQEAELSSPGPDERSFAMLAHALQIVGWFIAPLVIFLVRRESRFVAFHALQALLFQIAYMVLMGILFAGMFAAMFLSMPMEGSRSEKSDDGKAAMEQPRGDKTTDKEAAENQGDKKQEGGKQPTTRKKQAERPPVLFLLFFPIFWLLYMAMFVLMIVMSIVYSVKASRGEWAAYPIVGRWARRILA